MSRRRVLVAAGIAVSLCAMLSLTGCARMSDWFKTDQSRLLGPDQVVNSKATGSAINPIYTEIGPADITQELVPNATFPREGDWEYTDTDYTIGPTDVVDISVLDLFQEGLETVLRREVSASGFIDLPLLSERVLAEGLTQDQLKEAIAKAYTRANILLNPTVSVTIAARRQAMFSILGAVARPGPYNIVRKDMRLLEALAMAGGVTQSNIRYLYIIRPFPAIRRSLGDTRQARPAVPPEQLPELPPETPVKEGQLTSEATTAPGQETDRDRALKDLESALPGLLTEMQAAPLIVPMLAETEPTATTENDVGELRKASVPRPTKWIWEPGKGYRQVPVDGQEGAAIAGEPAAPSGPSEPPAAQREESDPFGWKEMDKSQLARIIAVKLSTLGSGDQRMNVIIRENDIVNIPTLEIGFFYMMGEVLRPGVYDLTGRRITVKQAIAAAGNPSPLAWPKNSILIRRVGENQEQIIPLDLEAIFHGDEPDHFLKPDDMVAVGTDVKASFMAVIRNAFRMTYGFGFIYDRNFADPYIPTLDDKRFKRW